ncbi:PEP-CTERM sorting domain-containing protein [Nostoc sp. FACHB-190]|uniref:PEP-CTERM sorting domain-containing protein n=1 Tax=Nostoc sp. FACHB-190 TaxID=2692838 RepID=UPI00168495FF|nr:PEP-CTERM sorting domain-containing protein [Nostoc sp. FACHB-190]MBD2297278.1 PEP-CTERM sorting domain-containing protein [Nostoc sp. FACHB-190]
MKQFQSVLFGATLAATTAAAVAFTPSSAQAITLYGELELQGAAAVQRLSPSQVSINFTDVKTVVSVPTFSDLSPSLGAGVPGVLPINIGGGSGIDIQDLTLNLVSGTTYATAAVTSFLNFGQRSLDGGNTFAALTFDLNPAQFFVQTIPNGGLAVSLLGTTGVWRFGEDIVGTAQISANDIGNVGGYTITATAVPEPITMGGLAVGAGFAGFLRKRYAKKDKQLTKA